MRYQSGPGYCGPAALGNALAALGIKSTEHELALNLGTTVSQGTTEWGLCQGLERAGFTWTEIKERKYTRAEETLFAGLNRGCPAILLAEAGDHWVAVVGVLGTRTVVVDSQNYAWNKRNNGVHVLEQGDQLRRYWEPYQGHRYALLINPK